MIELHHLFSAMADQQMALAPGGRQRLYWAWEGRKARAFERRMARRFDRLVVCSEDDMRALRRVVGEDDGGRIAVVPNGVDPSGFRVTPVPANRQILFPGTLGYLPNVDGARWFCTEVLPRVRAAVPDATVELVGRSPVAEVLDLAHLPGVVVHADVPSMPPYFEAARLVVVPLRIGTGTRLKALEAMAAARPVVGTSTGLEGIGIVDREHARVADDPESMASAIAEILEDDSLSGRHAAAGRAHVERQ